MSTIVDIARICISSIYAVRWPGGAISLNGSRIHLNTAAKVCDRGRLHARAERISKTVSRLSRRAGALLRQAGKEVVLKQS